MRKVITETETVYTFADLVKLSKESGEDGLDKALEWYTQGLSDYEWWDYTYELWSSALEQLGFLGVSIAHSGFCCQGDGASFECSNIDHEKLIQFLSEPPKAKTSIETDEAGKELFLPWLASKIGWGSLDANPRFKKLERLVDWGFISDLQVKRNCYQYVHQNTCEFQATLHDRDQFVDDGSAYGTHISKQPVVRQTFLDFVETCEKLRYMICLAIYKDLEDEWNYLTSPEAYLECDQDAEFLRDGSFFDYAPEDAEHKEVVRKMQVDIFLGRFVRHRRRINFSGRKRKKQNEQTDRP